MISKKAIIASSLTIALLILSAAGIPAFNKSALAAVTLASFTATGGDGQVLIEWETACEIDNIGFNLYRSTSEGGPYARINDSLIASEALGSVIGAYYCYTDSDVINGTTYYYKLEDVDVYGSSEFHGPISATPGAQPTATPTSTLTPAPPTPTLIPPYPPPLTPIPPTPTLVLPTATAIPPTPMYYRVYFPVILKNYSTPTPCLDRYEPDDTWQQARLIEVNQVIQSHNFHTTDDRDYVRFVAEAGSVYTIRTLNLSAGNDTVLTLYDNDGITQLEYNDDDPYNPPASKIVWFCPTTGTYFVKVAPFGTQIGGCDKTYDLKITTALAPTSTPTTPTSTPRVTETRFPTLTPTPVPPTPTPIIVTVRIEPTQSTVKVGESFTVSVMIDEVSDLGRFKFELFYTPTIVTVDDVTMGDFVGSTGRVVVEDPCDIDNEAGKVTFGAVTLGAEPGPGGTGELAVIRLTAQDRGESPLDLQGVLVQDTRAIGQAAADEDGWVVVESVTPTPTHTPTPSPTPTAIG